jgi:hypothetical protein
MSKTFTAKLLQYIFHAGYNDMDTFEKMSTEELPLTVDFTPRLAYNEILTTGSVVTAVDVAAPTVDVTATIIESNTISDDAQQLMCKVQGGINGHDYMLTFNGLTLPGGYVPKHQVLLQVRD